MRGGAVGSSGWTETSYAAGPMVMKGMHDVAVLRIHKPVEPQLECLVRCQIDNSRRSLILGFACRKLRSFITVASQAKLLLAGRASLGSAALPALHFASSFL